MNDFSIWNFIVPSKHLKKDAFEYLASLPKARPNVNWVWQEMDRVWFDLNLNNCLPLSDQLIAEFYSHPVWLMNGIFTSTDPESIGHRVAIANYINNSGFRKIADFGGGFGCLAITIAKSVSESNVVIIEPYPTDILLDTIKNVDNVDLSGNLGSSKDLDLLVAQDVLEHVEDPIQLAFELCSALRIGGEVIFANCFFPMIQCHLPSTFHLRHTFKWVMKSMGMQYVGKIKGAEHAIVFKRIGSINIKSARRAEYISKIFAPTINGLRKVLSVIKSALLKK